MAKKLILFWVWFIFVFVLPVIICLFVPGGYRFNLNLGFALLYYGAILGLAFGVIAFVKWLKKRKVGFTSILMAFALLLVIIPLSVLGTCVSGMFSDGLRSLFFK